jgi:hypothetical protein
MARKAIYSHHVGSGRFEGSATILWSISHNDHVVALGRESAFPDQVLSHIHGIINASIQLMLGTEVIDTDQESLFARHDERGDNCCC